MADNHLLLRGQLQRAWCSGGQGRGQTLNGLHANRPFTTRGFISANTQRSHYKAPEKQAACQVQGNGQWQALGAHRDEFW